MLAPVLCLGDFSKQVFLWTGTTLLGFGAVHKQLDKDCKCPIRSLCQYIGKQSRSMHHHILASKNFSYKIVK